MLSRRLPHLADEQLEAIQLLCDREMWRPAFALLRGLLECMASILWIARGSEDSPKRFIDGRMPSNQKVLGDVGWREEYQRTFRYLSDLAHPSADGAEAYRSFDFAQGRSIDEPAPEITPDMELYIVGLSTDDAVAVPLRALSPEELRTEYEPYLVAKAFDIVLSGLIRLYGEDGCRSATWWPHDGLDLFVRCVSENRKLREGVLFAGPEVRGAASP
jgi:hypothetical protein